MINEQNNIVIIDYDTDQETINNYITKKEQEEKQEELLWLKQSLTNIIKNVNDNFKYFYVDKIDVKIKEISCISDMKIDITLNDEK